MSEHSGRILVAEDDRGVRRVIVAALGAAGYELVEAGRFDEAAEELRSLDAWDAVIADIGLPGGSGLGLLEATRGEVPVIVITARTTMDNAVAAMRAGAFEYLCKPFDLAELEDAVQRAVVERRRADETPVALDDGVSERKVLIGRSRSMQRVFKAIGRAASRDAPVLIEGESGTGKELVARTIHHYSTRAGGPFVAVNMAALPAGLAESELFGHEKGAFTGAGAARAGWLRAADGGTLFLDEVGELALELQAKLLRVLEEGQVTPLGSTVPRKVSVRIISATNRGLADEVEAGRFRADLYYRLYVLPIVLPPLRERVDDIAELAEHFLGHIAANRGETPRRLTTDALRELQGRAWPGNVRQLMNVLLRAAAFSDGSSIDVVDLDGSASTVNPAEELRRAMEQLVASRIDGLMEEAPGDLHRLVSEAAEEALLRQVLRSVQGNQLKASRLLGIHRNTLHRRLKALGLDAGALRAPVGEAE